MQGKGHTWGNWREVVPDRWGLASYRGRHPKTMPGGIEDQPDERPDGRVLPVTRQAELRTPGIIDCVLEGRVVISSPSLKCSRRAAPGDGGWAVAAWPGCRKGSTPPDWMVSDLPDHQSACQSP